MTVKIFNYMQSIFNPRDVVVVEEEIEPKPILCEICGKESTNVTVVYPNPDSIAKSIQECEETMHFRCDEHSKL